MLLEKDKVFIEELYEPVKIVSIKRKKNEAPVYNLEVEDNKSYCVTEDSIIVHNCDMGMKGKNLNDLFSSIDNAIERTNISFCFSNKVYTNFGNIYDPYKQSGGESVIYNPSLSIKLTSTQDSEDVTDTALKEEKLRRKTALGSSLKTVRATISKSRFGTENRNATFLIDSCYGIMKNSGLFEMLKDFGILEKSGNYYTIPGIIDTGFLKKNFTEVFSKNEEKYIELLQKRLDEKEIEIKQKRMNLNISDISELDNTTDDDDDDGVNISELEADL